MRSVALFALPLIACGDVMDTTKTDARPPDTAPADATPQPPRCNISAPFGAPQPITELNTASTESGGTLSPDELTIYFASDRTGAGSVGMTDIYVATRPSIDQPFGTPAVLAGVNTAGQDDWPSISGDGLRIYIDRYAAGSTGWDIYSAQRTSTSLDFPAPDVVPAPLNATGGATDANQYLLPDGSAMYLCTSRNGSNDIYRAARNVGGTFDTPMVVSIPQGNSEQTAVVTPDELTILFSTDDPAGMGMADIWMAKRTTINDGFGTPQNTPLSSAANEHVVSISADGCNVYMIRAIQNRGYDLYWARKPAT